jgi:hypothetical protein
MWSGILGMGNFMTIGSNVAVLSGLTNFLACANQGYAVMTSVGGAGGAFFLAGRPRSPLP